MVAYHGTASPSGGPGRLTQGPPHRSLSTPPPGPVRETRASSRAQWPHMAAADQPPSNARELCRCPVSPGWPRRDPGRKGLQEGLAGPEGAPCSTGRVGSPAPVTACRGQTCSSRF